MAHALLPLTNLKFKYLLAGGSMLAAFGLAVDANPRWMGDWIRDRPTPPEAALTLQLSQQQWLQPGDRIGNYRVLAGLGDISIALNNQAVYAPSDGKTAPDTRDCLMFSTPVAPDSLLRLCGLTQPRWGQVSTGMEIGRASTLQLAALQKQPNGTWAMVEPSQSLLERTLTPK